MADAGPNYKVEQQRLIKEISELETRFEGHKLSLLELVGRKQTILQNWAAEREALEHKKANLKDLEEAHGPVLELDIDAAMSEIDSMVKGS